MMKLAVLLLFAGCSLSQAHVLGQKPDTSGSADETADAKTLSLELCLELRQIWEELTILHVCMYIRLCL